MNAKLIDRLARIDPQIPSFWDRQVRVVLQVQTNPAFGWYIARAFASARLPFPEVVTGRDHWLLQAYLAFLNPSAEQSPHLADAHRIHDAPGTLAATLKALLIAGLGEPIDDHLQLVAAKTGIPVQTVEAFEILFFNVLERHKDGLYLSNLVYPNGRTVEFEDGYVVNTPAADLLLRAAYNSRDVALVEHLAGLDGAAMVKKLRAMGDLGPEKELESRTMGNALLISQTGMINQRGPGLQRAVNLLGGTRKRSKKLQPVAEPEDCDIASHLAAALSAVPPITQEERRHLQATSRPGQWYLHDESGNIVAMDQSGTAHDPDPFAESPSMVKFPEPRPAVWKNQDYDKPVILVARMSQPGLPDYYLTQEGSGIPVSEVTFENQDWSASN